MPEVQEVFRMATQKVRPHPGALERQQRKQRWQVGKQKAAVYGLVAGLVVGGILLGVSLLRQGEERPATRPPQQDGPVVEGLPPTPELLTGVWVSEAGDGLMAQFTEDGRWRIGDGGLLDRDPWARGTYEVEGGTITLEAQRSPQEGGYLCMRWDAGLPEDGKLDTVAREDPDCRAFAGTEVSFIRVSPQSPPGDRLTADAPFGQGAPIPGSGSTLSGIYLMEGGRLLRFSTDRTYALDSEGTLATEPQDVGTFEVSDEGETLTFTSGADSRTCAQGDVTVWTDVRFRAGSALAGTIQRADCSTHAGLGGRWVRVSP